MAHKRCWCCCVALVPLQAVLVLLCCSCAPTSGAGVAVLLLFPYKRCWCCCVALVPLQAVLVLLCCSCASTSGAGVAVLLLCPYKRCWCCCVALVPLSLTRSAPSSSSLRATTSPCWRCMTRGRPTSSATPGATKTSSRWVRDALHTTPQHLGGCMCLTHIPAPTTSTPHGKMACEIPALLPAWAAPAHRTTYKHFTLLLHVHVQGCSSLLHLNGPRHTHAIFAGATAMHVLTLCRA